MEHQFVCHFMFEEQKYLAQVSFIDMDPLPQFLVTQTDQDLIDKYGHKQVFTYEHGIFTWGSGGTDFYDGYLKTAIAEGLSDCINSTFRLSELICSYINEKTLHSQFPADLTEI